MKRSKYKLLLTTFMGTLALTLSANFTYSQLVTRAYGDVNTSSNIDLQMSDSNTGTAVQNNLTLTNNGEAVDLSKVTIRYYFTSDNSAAQTFNCYDGSITSGDNYENIASYIKGNFVKLDTPLKGADTYLEISFDKEAGTFNSSDILKLQTAINNNDWSSFDSSNDYSFNDASKAVVLIDGQVVSGIIPNEKAEIAENPVSPVKDVKDMNVTVSEDSGTSSNSVNPTFTITNTGNCDLNLKDVDLKYYYTADSDAEQAFSCYYAGTIDGDYKSLTSAVSGNIEKLETPVDNADSCLNLTFTDGVLKAGQSMKVQTNINKSDWSSFDKSNDYSYNDSDKVVASIVGSVISGTSPIKNTVSDDKKNDEPKLTVARVSAKGGSTIRIPIKVSNISEKGMKKFHLKLAYDPELMEYDSIYSTGNLDSFCCFTGNGNDYKNHIVDLGFDCSKGEYGSIPPVYNDGAYCSVSFKVKPTVENCTTSLKLIDEPVIIDADGNEYSNIEINPITLIYNKDIVKNSSLSENTFSYTEDTLNDITIPMKLYENTLSGIYVNTPSRVINLTEGLDYEVDGSNLILKKDYLKTLLNTNTFLNVKFSAGDDQTILIKNTDFDEIVDTSRCGFSDNEANIKFETINNSPESTDKIDLTFALTNTSNVDIKPGDLDINYYYLSEDSKEQADKFHMDYAKVLENNKSFSDFTKAYINRLPSYNDKPGNSYLDVHFADYSDPLKPGETIIIHGYIYNDDNILYSQSNDHSYLDKMNTVVTYKSPYDSIFGDMPDGSSMESRISCKDISINSSNSEDKSMYINLGNNRLTSLDQYFNGKLTKTLEYGKDYVMTDRHTLVLKKAYFDSLSESPVTLTFNFNQDISSSIKVTKSGLSAGQTLNAGSLEITNDPIAAFTQDVYDANHMRSEEWLPFDVPIYVSYTKTDDICGCSFSLQYDSRIMKNIELKPADPSISASVNKSLSTIDVVVPASYKLDKNVPIVTLSLTPSRLAGHCDGNLQMAPYSFYTTSDGTKYKMRYKSNDIKLFSEYVRPKLSAYFSNSLSQGSTITIPVNVTDAKYFNIPSFNYTINYDPAVFESISMTPGTICNNTDGVFTSSDDNENGKFVVQYNANKDKSYDIKEDGNILNVTFKVKDDAPLGTYFIDYDTSSTINSYKHGTDYVFNDTCAELPIKVLTIQ